MHDVRGSRPTKVANELPLKQLRIDPRQIDRVGCEGVIGSDRPHHQLQRRFHCRSKLKRTFVGCDPMVQFAELDPVDRQPR